MTLTKQLWVAVALVMALAFSCSAVVSILSARDYLQNALEVKNIDNATSLALSLSQLDKDPVTVELQIAAQFDAGHYRFIRVVSPTGEVLVEKTFTGKQALVPRWFMQWVPLRAEPGRAQITDGWKQYGTLTLASHDIYAYQSLWNGTLKLLGWFVLFGLLAGISGTWLIRWILRPLGDVVGQAEAIAERRFLTIPQPRTPELRKVVQAMNGMVARLKTMLAEETARLESLRKKVTTDQVTGLASREYFLSHLHDILQGEEFARMGSLVLVQISDLAQLNKQLGHNRVNTLLQGLGQALHSNAEGHTGLSAGRLKGAEFAVVCPAFASATEAALHVHRSLSDTWLPAWIHEAPDLFHVAAVHYHHGQTLGDLLLHADEALAHAQSQGPNNWYASEDGDTHPVLPPDQWRTLLTEAVSGGRLSLVFYPVVKGDGQADIHKEGMIRLQADDAGQPLRAGDFMPMAAHLNLTIPIDLKVVQLAIEHLRQSQGDIAVNLSADTIADFGFRRQLTELLAAYPDICKRLLFEVPEYGVFRHFDAFRDIARALKRLGSRVGIECFGQRFARGELLADLGLDYIKIHPSYVHGIAANPGNQEFLRGLCTLAHTLGIAVIAVGVEARADLPLLASLGFDGATGPGLRQQP